MLIIASLFQRLFICHSQRTATKRIFSLTPIDCCWQWVACPAGIILRLSQGENRKFTTRWSFNCSTCHEKRGIEARKIVMRHPQSKWKSYSRALADFLCWNHRHNIVLEEEALLRFLVDEDGWTCLLVFTYVSAQPRKLIFRMKRDLAYIETWNKRSLIAQQLIDDEMSEWERGLDSPVVLLMIDDRSWHWCRPQNHSAEGTPGC